MIMDTEGRRCLAMRRGNATDSGAGRMTVDWTRRQWIRFRRRLRHEARYGGGPNPIVQYTLILLVAVATLVLVLYTLKVV